MLSKLFIILKIKKSECIEIKTKFMVVHANSML